MGLGKTLTILSLIMSNFHDTRPLARPHHGYKRQLDKNVGKYLPQRQSKQAINNNRNVQRNLKEVGATINRVKASSNFNLQTMLGGMEDSPDKPVSKKGKASSKHKAKNTKAKLEFKSDLIPKTTEDILASVDESIMDDTKDEFDSMLDESDGGLADKLGIDSSSELLQKEEVKFRDGLSDDEEYQKMTEEERNERMKPKLNLDGAADISTDDDDEPLVSSTFGRRNRKRNRRVNDSDSDEDFVTSTKSKKKKAGKATNGFDLRAAMGAQQSDGGSDGENFDLPDIEDEEEDTEKPKHPENQDGSDEEKETVTKKIPELSEEQKKNLIKAKRDPATCGSRRRATLIVTPTSLISHWIEQIETHIDKRVNLKIYVHHGQNRALIARELEDQDIVFTTYGTLMWEFNDMSNPLMKAKWLRVCLDEGHMVKNHRSKTSKAAYELNTERRWIVSGEPLRNFERGHFRVLNNSNFH